ncbi:MAG TPA: DUF5667 domain-containing protein [Anaerolineales bacterium]|nr:DUF5667 domain-containing protein [Anaerolineales bacterium]
MNKQNSNETDPRLLALLDELKPFPRRHPGAAARARARFLAEAVSSQEQRRHSLWNIFQQKEQFAMKLVLSIFVIAGLLFGGNATVSAAQDDLPDQPLYAVKLMAEEMRLRLQVDPSLQIETLMRQAQTRTEEMAALTENGIVPPAELSRRAQERIERALQLTAALEDPARTATLQRIHTQLQTQEQMMSRLQDGTCMACEPVLLQTREMLRSQLRQMEGGLDQLQPSPNQTQNQQQIHSTQTPMMIRQTAMPQASRTPLQNGIGQQNGSGNPAAGTPMPQNNAGDQNSGGMQNGPGEGGSPQNGSGDSDGGSDGSGQGSGGQGGQGGKP